MARDLGTDVAGGSRRRRQTENREQRRAGDKKSGTARHSCSTPLEFCSQLPVEWNTIRGPTSCEAVPLHGNCLWWSPATEIGHGQDQDPALQTRRCKLSVVEVHSHLRFAQCCWRRVNGPSRVSTQGPETRHGHQSGQVTQILDEVSVRVQHMTGIKDSAQLDGAGRERRVLQLKASGERHDGFCKRCLAEGVEEKATMGAHNVAMPLMSHWWHSQRRQSSTTPPQFAV